MKKYIESYQDPYTGKATEIYKCEKEYYTVDDEETKYLCGVNDDYKMALSERYY